MRKILIPFFILFCVVPVIAGFWVLSITLKGERLENLKELSFEVVDPRPLVIPNADFLETQTTHDGMKIPEHWTLEGKGFLAEDETTKEVSLHLHPVSCWASEPIPLQSGGFYQVKTRYFDPLQHRENPYFGLDFAGTDCDTMYYGHHNTGWITLSNFQQVPYDTTEAKILMGLGSYKSSRSQREKTIQYRDVELLPARCVYQAVRKNSPLNDIYWGREIGVKRTPPPGEFLLLGEHERLNSYDKSRSAQYHLEGLTQDYDFRTAEKSQNPPAVTLHRRPIIKSKLYRQAQFNSNSWTFDKDSEIIFRFDFQPIQIFEDGSYETGDPIAILSAKLWFTFLSTATGNKGVWTEIEYGDDGIHWKKLENTAQWSYQQFTCEFGKDFFPKNQLYLRIRIPDAMKKQCRYASVNQFRFDAELDTKDYDGYGKQTFYEVTPGTETWDGPTKIWPLFCATNQMYFLYRNESDQPIIPKIGGKHNYTYYGPETANPIDTVAPHPEFSPSWQHQPRTVQYEIIPNNSMEINDLTFHWEVVGSEDGTIPPKTERIVVFTLEAKRLRASSHQQFGSYIDDTMDAEFHLGPYNLTAPKVRFFPPRLVIE
jgi:hypothetical protein